MLTTERRPALVFSLFLADAQGPKGFGGAPRSERAVHAARTQELSSLRCSTHESLLIGSYRVRLDSTTGTQRKSCGCSRKAVL
ncbi:hypothetical protein F2P81_018220 [Scophthalmus maximus]|uniref:Uncharacterized protein n=1 Tax=Scophthalmus maximus TaxID=52904 RepID=A0A6A4S9T2_SCOMX|nr:hypothetical protein F2P81_018220 [Scophthalmus maximus]